VQQAFALFFVAIAWTFLATFLLLCTETSMEITAQQGLLTRVLFEVLSAFGTVGLSTGITESFSSIGKIILILTMFVGRIGPLTLVLGMSRPDTRSALQYPEGKISIG
jgi:trk system potassium uptake protein TrkH